MTVDNLPESYEGLEYTLKAAEARAAELRAEGRQTQIEESQFHYGQYVVFATPLPEAPKVVEDTQEPTVENLAQAAIAGSVPAVLETRSETSVYHSQVEAEAAAKKLQLAGHKTVLRHSGFHPARWSVYSSRLEGK